MQAIEKKGFACGRNPGYHPLINKYFLFIVYGVIKYFLFEEPWHHWLMGRKSNPFPPVTATFFYFIITLKRKIILFCDRVWSCWLPLTKKPGISAFIFFYFTRSLFQSFNIYLSFCNVHYKYNWTYYYFIV